MTSFEFLYGFFRPFTLPLHQLVHRHLKALFIEHNSPVILDVGGRKSHYTIGLKQQITISDIPRDTDVQRDLHLGINSQIIEQTKTRRSNIKEIVYDDLTRSKLPDNNYDFVVAIEVLEHVEQDELFVENAHRILKPGGTFYMTTPNGDFVENNNPDHKRHYQRSQLQSLLERHFSEVQVDYGITGGKYQRWGLAPWSPKRPLKTLKSMIGNFINFRQSGQHLVKDQFQNTFHLIAKAIK